MRAPVAYRTATESPKYAARRVIVKNGGNAIDRCGPPFFDRRSFFRLQNHRQCANAPTPGSGGSAIPGG